MIGERLRPVPPDPYAPIHPRFDRRLSVALDRAVVQIEVAEQIGDTATARAWRRVLAELGQRIPETDR